MTSGSCSAPGHSPNHGGVLLPDALPWLFRPADVVSQE
jgi:hypothetical protein